MARRFLRPHGATSGRGGPGQIVVMPMSASTVPFTTWTVDTVLSAIDQHEEGSFCESSKLIDSFGRDERIRADLATRANALVGKNALEFSIVGEDNGRPASAKAGAKGKHVEEVESWFWDAIPEDVQRATIRSAVMCGVAYGPIRWTPVDGQWLPRVEIWPNEALWWDDSRSVYRAATQQGQVDIVPGTGEWFLFAPDGARSWMAGAVRALGLLALMRRFTYRGWSRFCERHGLPIIAVTEPGGADDPNDTSKRSFYSSMRNLGSTGVVRLPSDEWKLDLKELSSTGWKAFQEFLRDASTAISITLLGQNLTTEVRGGSYAAAQAHLRVRQDYLDSDANGFADAIRDCVVKPWGRFNLRGWNDTDAPWPQWNTGIPEDRKAKADTWKSAGEALKGLRDQRIPVDVAGWCEQFGIPLIDGAVMPELPEERQAQPVPTPPDDDESEAEDEGDDTDEPPDSNAGGAVEARHRARPQAAASDPDPGDQYVSRLTESLSGTVATDLDGHIAEILAIVQRAESPDDYEAIRQQIVDYYRDKMDPGTIADLTRAGLVLAQLAGRFTVLGEVADGEP
jgi:phage gp29-like protein